MNSKDIKRIEYIDVTKLLAIFLVIWGHVMQFGYLYPTDISFYNNRLWELIYSFHMPLFMTISGIFADRLLSKSFDRVIVEKAIQLLLPAVVWSVIWNLFIQIYQGVAFDWSAFGLQIFLDFWFLKSLFICSLIFYVSIKVLKNKVWACIVSCLLFVAIFPIYYSNVFFLLPYFWMGYFIKDFLLKNRHRLMIAMVSLAVFVVLFHFWKGLYTVYAMPSLIFDVRNFSFSLNNLFLSLYRFAIGAFGSLTILFLMKEIVKKKAKIGELANWGRHTMGVYLVQSFVIYFIFHFYKFPRTISIYCFNLIYSPIISLVVLLVCLLILFVIRKFDFLKLFFLGEVKSKGETSNQN